jgi:lipopolysaccharide export system protein LptA
MRTLVLGAGVLLLAALVIFLVIGKWKNPFNRRDIPQRLGIEIQQEANGVTYTQASGGHTLFKIHASKVVQLKKGNALLHDVKIELYGADGSRADRIEGDEFEYDQHAGTARAAGPVEITLMRPGEALAIVPKANAEKALGDKAKSGVLAAAARGEIHVRTSGLVFDQHSGVASTKESVEFEMTQGAGSAMGATYDSQQGHLVLDRAVELNTRRGADPVKIQAHHAEFERADQVCNLQGATASFRGGAATAEDAKILFRDDGSAERLDATNGFKMTTVAGGRMAAPTGVLEFDEHNQPRHGHLEGGVTIDEDNRGRQVHGTAPGMEMEFTSEGQLRRAHLERGVEITTNERSGVGGTAARTHRAWRSPVADVEFRNAGHGSVEPAAIHGSQGVVVSGENQRGSGPVALSRLTANDVWGAFGADSVLTSMTGTGHASMEQTTVAGAHQTTSGDRLVAHFAAGQGKGTGAGSKSGDRGEQANGTEIQSATVEGNVVLVQAPAEKQGAAAESPMRATAGRAVYEQTGEWLHLTESPRVEDGGLQLVADKLDVSQSSGDAFAHGNVKATWLGGDAAGAGKQGRSAVAPQAQAATLGGQGPSHAIAAEAQIHQATGEATFRGQARLWQQADSISAPEIVLNRDRQILVARSASAAEPVRVVLLTAVSVAPGKAGKPGESSVVRVRGSDLKYSAAERKAVMHGGAAGSVVAETAEATTVSSEVDLVLLPPGNHAGKDGAAAQVDTMTARGHVTITSQDRKGSGEQLVYSSGTGEYVLTGTAAAPPRMTDPAHGTVSGEALIFNSRDDSVSIEGGGRKTTTETTAPKHGQNRQRD